MDSISRVEDLRSATRLWRMAGERIGFVPTMGNLHEGHVTLLERAARVADRVVVGVFVNPLQFGPFEDYEQYPRTPDSDSEKCAAAGAHVLFAPSVADMYPLGREAATRIVVPFISEILCGADRPGHFVGVATVVAKLLNLVTPDVAVFGEKDFQQLLVIRRMVTDLRMPVEIVGAPTNREPDGLAMSSRNQYLSAEERAVAPELHATLSATAEAIRSGDADLATLQKNGAERLERAGFRPSYYEIRQAEDLAPPRDGCAELVVLAAAWLSKARLIDNVRVKRPTL